jgi:hypothetical protein
MTTIPFVTVDEVTLEIVNRYFKRDGEGSLPPTLPVSPTGSAITSTINIQVQDDLNISSVKAVKDTQTLTLSVEDYELLDDTDKTVWVAKKASESDVIESYEQTKTEITLVATDVVTKWNDPIRLERNALLLSSDKYMLDDWPHASPAVKTAWVDYRQALRDMETIAADPENPKWPTKPSS